MHILAKHEIENMLSCLGLFGGDSGGFAVTRLEEMGKRRKWGASSFPHVRGAYGPTTTDAIPVEKLGLGIDDAGMADYKKVLIDWAIPLSGLPATSVEHMPLDELRKRLDPSYKNSDRLNLLAYIYGNQPDYQNRPDVLVLGSFDKEDGIHRLYYFIG